MIKIGVFEDRFAEYSKKIAYGFAKAGKEVILINSPPLFCEMLGRDDFVLVQNLDSELMLDGLALDIFVSAPERIAKSQKAAYSLNCKTAVLFGKDAPDLTGQLHARSIVTYGMSPKDTITVSSVDDENLIVAIQREMIDLQNSPIEEQEINIKITDQSDVDSFMAVTAVMLLAHVEKEKLPDIFE